ncbi:MAG: LysM peptidoglycan-binding domain-containing protein [Clostridiaceae bacterium]|nr:LysM peptidoglycan-binding domain-containing protein [Clostridiaceae bacterium]
MRRRYRLKNKRRFAAFIIFIVMVTVFTGMIANAGTTSNVKQEYKTVKVKNGDTLWEIASAHKNNKDIREYIYDMKKLNNLQSDIIHAGQILLLP